MGVSAEVKRSADKDQEGAENEEGAAEFAEGSMKRV